MGPSGHSHRQTSECHGELVWLMVSLGEREEIKCEWKVELCAARMRAVEKGQLGSEPSMLKTLRGVIEMMPGFLVPEDGE